MPIVQFWRQSVDAREGRRIVHEAVGRLERDRRLALGVGDRHAFLAHLDAEIRLRDGRAQARRRRRLGFGQPGREPRRRGQPRIVELGGELDRLPERQIDQLLEPEVGDVAVVAGADARRLQRVAIDLGAQQLELRDQAGLALGARLLQRARRLRQRLVGDAEDPIGQRRVVERLRHVERELGLGLPDRQRRRFAAEPRLALERALAAAGVDQLREREAEAVGVGLSERQVGEGVVAAVLAAADGVGVEDAFELGLQGAVVGRGAGQLRQALAVHLGLDAAGAADTGLGDEDGFIADVGERQGIVERQHPRPLSSLGGAGAGDTACGDTACGAGAGAACAAPRDGAASTAAASDVATKRTDRRDMRAHTPRNERLR